MNPDHGSCSIGGLLESRFGLEPASVAAVEAAVTRRRYSRGSIVARQGSTWNELLFVCSGAARSWAVTSQGDEISYFLFFEGSWVCDLRSYAESRPGRFNFEAMEDLEVASLDRAALDRLLLRHAGLARCVFALSLESYAQLDRRMESFMFQPPAERYLAFMAQYRDQAGRIPQYILASYLGVKPESLSRIKKRLVRQGRLLNPDQ